MGCLAIIALLIVLFIGMLFIAYGMRGKTENFLGDDMPIEDNYTSVNFVESKFHSDYMDAMASFNNLTSGYRQIFNINNVPCRIEYIDKNDLVNGIAKRFIILLNDDINKNSSCARQQWNSAFVDPQIESGWEKVQKRLGLPHSLYDSPMKNTGIMLDGVENIIKYETENEDKYKFNAILSRDGTGDKLVIIISAVMPKNGNDNFVIESIDIIGYLSNYDMGISETYNGDFYNFDRMENNEMFTGKSIIAELVKKYESKNKLMQEKIDRMDPFVRDKYANTPTPACYDTYRVTQTIFDDINI